MKKFVFVFSLLFGVVVGGTYLFGAGRHGLEPEEAAWRNTIHYAPEENLEHLEVNALAQASKTVDIAMYAFSDQAIAEELGVLAHTGVKVRLYRDGGQFVEETRRSSPVRTILASGCCIQIRVKGSRTLMHDKAYVIDRQMLRTGSANWSPTGLKRQDNDIVFTTNRAEVDAFEANFARMWEREGNVNAQ